MKTVLAAFLSVAPACPALAEAWAGPVQSIGVMGRMKAEEERAPLPVCPAPKPGARDPGRGLDCAIPYNKKGDAGIFGLRNPESITLPLANLDKSPVNTGFKALGRAGQTGEVDGPGRQGNGTYKVGKNDPYQLDLWIATGYVQGWVGLKRDAASGRDTLSFSGKYWDQGKGGWGPHVDGSNDVQITYDAGRDRGKIRWQENGKWKEEGYWDGKEGRKSMTIELAGGWDHDFERD